MSRESKGHPTQRAEPDNDPMASLSESDKSRIAKAIEERGGIMPCPRCASTEFTVADGYLNQTIQTELTGLVIGGPSIPSALIVCTNCGFISQHALGVLGLLPPQPPKREA